MKKYIKIIFAALMAVTIFVSSVPADAAVKLSNGKTSMTTHQYFNGNNYNGTYIYTLNNVKSKLTAKSFTSSNKEVATPKRFTSHLYDYKYFDTKPYKSFGAEYEVSAKKPGKATLSLKIGSTKLKHTVNYYAYENPAKSFKAPGSKELKSCFADYYYCASNKKGRIFTKDVKSGKLTVKAASGWKITGYNVQTSRDQDNNGEASSDSFSRDFKKPVSSFSYTVGKVDKKDSMRYSVDFINTKTKGTLSLVYYTFAS